MNTFHVKQWGASEQSFKTARDAVRHAVNILNPSKQSKAGLAIYLQRALSTYFVVEYQDVVIRHMLEHDDGAKHLPTYTEVL